MTTRTTTKGGGREKKENINLFKKCKSSTTPVRQQQYHVNIKQLLTLPTSALSTDTNALTTWAHKIAKIAKIGNNLRLKYASKQIAIFCNKIKQNS
jgi:hypothetical protein